jgi:isopenicillin-N epimerase
MDALTLRTKLLIIDHVTSPTAVVFPVDRIVRAARARGVLVLVDAAHTPGMLDVDLGHLDPDFWTGNFHKWVCAPKGAAVLYAAPARKDRVHPVVTSHGYGRGLHPEFDWTGTADPTPYLSIPAALDFMEGLGWDRLRRHNHSLVTLGRDLLATALGTPPQVPEAALGSMAVVELPGAAGSTAERATALQTGLYAAERIEVPVGSWGGRGFVRLSAQAYNAPAEFELLARAFPSLLAEAEA